MNPEPFKLKEREGDAPELRSEDHNAAFAYQCGGSSLELIDALKREISHRFPHDVVVQRCQSRPSHHGGFVCLAAQLKSTSRTLGPPEAFFNNDIQTKEFLLIATSPEHPDRYALTLHLPNESKFELEQKGWGSEIIKASPSEMLVFLPRTINELEVIFSIIYQSYLYAKGSESFVIPNSLNLPRIYGKEEEDAVLEVVRSGFMSRYSSWESSKVHCFEKACAEYLGVKHCLMLNSGTSALVCALAGLNIGPGDHVLVSSFTWISTAAAVIAVGAIPIVYEIDESLGPDVEDLRRKFTPRTKAVIVTHMMGSACHMELIQQVVVQELKLGLIEDCCQSVGGKYRGRALGTFGDAGVWSMNYHKNICVGEGGLLFTNRRDIYERAWSASEPAFQEPHTLGSVSKSPEMRQFFSQWQTDHFVHSTLRGSELAAALGLAQLPKLDAQLAHTRALRNYFLWLISLSSASAGRHFKVQPIGCDEGDCGINVAILINNNSESTSKLDSDSDSLVSKFVRALRAEQIGVRPIFSLKDRDNRVAYWWDSILEHKGMSSANYPWRDPSFDHAEPAEAALAESRQRVCPRSLDIMSRTLCFSFSNRMTKYHVELMANALISVDQQIS